MPNRTTIAAVAALAATALVPSSAGAAVKGVRYFTGPVAGSDAFVAVAVAGPAKKPLFAQVYVCDGANGISEYFSGLAPRGRAAEMPGHDWEQRGREARLDVKARAPKGTIELVDGRPLRFSTTRTKGNAGYWAASAREQNGSYARWVRLADGRLQGAVKTGTTTTAAPSFQPGGTADLNGATVTPVKHQPTVVTSPFFWPELF